MAGTWGTCPFRRYHVGDKCCVSRAGSEWLLPFSGALYGPGRGCIRAPFKRANGVRRGISTSAMEQLITSSDTINYISFFCSSLIVLLKIVQLSQVTSYFLQQKSVTFKLSDAFSVIVHEQQGCFFALHSCYIKQVREIKV